MGFLTTIPPEAWAGLVGIIIGSSLSVIGVWLTNKSSHKQLETQLKHEQNAQERKIERERFEELHILVSGWLNLMADQYLSLSMVMQGKLSYNEHYDLFSEQVNSTKFDSNRLKMIVAIYADHLKDDFQNILEARTQLNSIAHMHKEEYRLGDNSEKHLKAYVGAQMQIEKLGELFKEKIANGVKNA